MFHLLTVELLHWDYCRRVQLPLDGAIIAIAGPNGSGKTTLLDGLRTLLGLECSGGRTYKTYARHANTQQIWLRATVDNKPLSRQSSSRPFASSLLMSDVVSLACRIDRAGGDWQRRYLMAEGDCSVEQLIARPDKEVQWLGVEAWRKRLAAAGLTPAIARVLSLEQGQTDRLCELSARELLRLVFDVFGDQEVLNAYQKAKEHQADLARELAQADRDLVTSQAQLATLRAEVESWKQRRLKLAERERLETEVIPVLSWSEERSELAKSSRQLHASRLAATAERGRLSTRRRELKDLHDALAAAQGAKATAASARREADKALKDARDAEQPVERLVQEEAELRELAKVEAGAAMAALAQKLSDLQAAIRLHEKNYSDAVERRNAAQAELDALTGMKMPPAPREVTEFRKALRAASVEHQTLAEIVEVTDEHWRRAVEGVLRGYSWMVMLDAASDEQAAFALAEKSRYRHYVVVADKHDVGVPPGSLLEVTKFSSDVPSWLRKHLASIRRAETIEAGRKGAGEWITPQAYFRDNRGGRSVWVDDAQFQFGAAALQAKRAYLAATLDHEDAAMVRAANELTPLKRQAAQVTKSLEGHKAADELARRAAEFADAQARFPALKQARIAAGTRWSLCDAALTEANKTEQRLEREYEESSRGLVQAEQKLKQSELDLQRQRQASIDKTKESNAIRARLPSRWRTVERLTELRKEYLNSQQAKLRQKAVELELETGTWVTDDTVEERCSLMKARVDEQAISVEDAKARNASAGTAVDNARGKYIEVLRATARRYRRNIVELGELAGVTVEAEPPHLDNDDTTLAQAGLHVKFNFDGKAAIGLNDGEASGGQQVMKSLILLVGLLKDEETPGGFVFIDEPFAHLDVRNIQLVSHFLRSTRAQYLLTTPITHNVEVFEPAEIMLVTSTKVVGERWAPPIAVVQRRLDGQTRKAA
jgi:chromosome segregation ATPase